MDSSTLSAIANTLVGVTVESLGNIIKSKPDEILWMLPGNPFFSHVNKGEVSPCTQKTFHLDLTAIKSMQHSSCTCKNQSLCIFTYMLLLIPDGLLGFADVCKARGGGGGGECVWRGGPPNVQNTQINRTGGLQLCKCLEGKLAVRTAGEGRISRSHYATQANCI